MKRGQNKERRKLTFSQREGKVPLPKPMQLDELSKGFKGRLWSAIEERFFSDKRSFYEYEDFDEVDFGGDFWYKCAESYYYDILRKGYKEIPWGKNFVDSFLENIKKTILGNSEPHQVITVAEHIIRATNIPDSLIEQIKEAFRHAPYFVDDSEQPFCIMPAASEEEKSAIQDAFLTLEDTGMAGAKTHLCQSVDHINKQNYADSVRESIHAVESVAKTIDTSSNTLANALTSLRNRGLIKHSALLEGFKKLYGYTNDEKGIRHSLADQEEADVEQEEAVFMFGACASFAAYLAAKQRQMKNANVQP